MFVKEGIYFPLFSDDNFCPHTSLIAVTNPFPSSFFANFFNEVTPVVGVHHFARPLIMLALYDLLLPGVPLIVVIVMSATATLTDQG